MNKSFRLLQTIMLLTAVLLMGVLLAQPSLAAPGDIHTVAGNGSTDMPDGLYLPRGVHMTPGGDVYVADTYNHRIVKILATGVTATVAGNGYGDFCGDGGQAIEACLFYPSSIFVDLAGNLFIADTMNDRIRKVDTNGVISTVTGTSFSGYMGDFGPAADATLNGPTGVVVKASGEMFIADRGNYAIRKIDTNGTITTFITLSYLQQPYALALDPNGTLYLSTHGSGVWKDNTTNIVSVPSCTLARGLSIPLVDTVYMACPLENKIIKSPPGGSLTPVAGMGTAGFSGDEGPAASALLDAPWGVAADTVGPLYIVDSGNHRVRTMEMHDNVPDPFGFADVSAAPLGTMVESASITVAGIGGAARITVTGGEYSVNGSAFLSVPGGVNNGDVVVVHVLSSSQYGTTTSTTLTIGGISGTFNATTVHDFTPDPFALTDQTNVALDSIITSNSIIVSGITATVPIGITGGEYEINDSSLWSGTNGLVANGDWVRIRQTSSSSPTTTTDVVLTIGGVSDTFSVTTGSGLTCAEPLSPSPNWQDMGTSVNDLGEAVWAENIMGPHQIMSSTRGQLTSDANDHTNPSVNNRGDVVWQQGDIIYGLISGMVQQLTFGGSAYAPSINDHQEVVWSQRNGVNDQIYSNLRGWLTSDPVDHGDPSINNAGDVVWSQNGNIYGLISGQAQQLTFSGNAFSPSISNSGEVVWSEWNGGGQRIYSSLRGQLTFDGCPGGTSHGWPSVNACGDVIFSVFGTGSQVYRLGNASPCVTDAEPNNTLPEATLVSGNSTTTGMVQDPGDVQDWYKFAANAGDQIKVTVNWAPTVIPNMLLFDLWNQSGGWLASPTEPGSPMTITYTATYSGTYYVHIMTVPAGRSGYSLSIKVGLGSGTCAEPVSPSPNWQDMGTSVNDLGEAVWAENIMGPHQIMSSTRGQLTSDANDHTNPSVNNRGDVVWQQGDIIYGLISGQVQQLTFGGSAYAPSINDHQEVVWSQRNGVNDQIYSNLRGWLTSDPVDHGDPSINNAGDVVWSQNGNIYGLISGQAQQLTFSGNAFSPSISNSGEVVWSEWNGGGQRIYSSLRGQLTFDGCPGGTSHGWPSVNACGDVIFSVFGTGSQVYRLGNASPCVTDAEPNNMLPEATLVSGNSTTTGMVQDPGDWEDWYKFTANTGDQITVTVNWAPTVAPNMLMVDLMDQYGGGLTSAPEPGSPKTITYTAQYSGTYHVHLRAIPGSRVGYTLTLKVGLGSGTCAEPVSPSSNWQDMGTAVNDLGEAVWAENIMGPHQIMSSTRGQLTSDANDHTNPSVNNRGDVVWQQGDIIYGLISGQVQQLTFTGNAYGPSINDHQEVVWSQRNGVNDQIYSNQRGWLTSDPVDHGVPSINNAGDVVWSQNGNIYGLISGQVQQLTFSGNAWYPSISNSDEVVWSEWNGGGQRIYSSLRGQLTFDGCPGGTSHGWPSVNACGDVIFSVFGTGSQVYRLGNASPCVSDTEPNNILPEATLVSGNSTTMGMVQEPGDFEDWYKFTANAGDTIRVNVNWSPIVAGNNVIVELTGALGVIAVAPDPGSPKTVTHTAAFSGTYYVHLMAMPGSRVGYTFSVNITPAPTHDLTIVRAGTGNGSTSISPPGTPCGTECSSHVESSIITLTATPSAGSTFTGWSNDPDCADGMVTMNAPKNCIATFTLSPVSSATLTANLVSPQFVGVPVTFTAGGEGGSGTYQYKFQYKLSTDATWTMARAYSADNTWTWSTGSLTAGSYLVQAWVRNAGSTAAYEAIKTAGFTLASPVATGVSLSASPVSTQVTGASVTFTAQGAGGSGSYEYKFFYKLSTDTKLTLARGYAASNTWTWNTSGFVTGSYIIQVWARHMGSTANYEVLRTIGYTLKTPPASGATLSAGPASPQPAGTPVTFTTLATGGSGSYQYQFLYKLSTNPTMTVAQNYSSAGTWNWSTGGELAGNYIIQVRVRNAGSTAGYETLRTIGYTLQ